MLHHQGWTAWCRQDALHVRLVSREDIKAGATFKGLQNPVERESYWTNERLRLKMSESVLLILLLYSTWLCHLIPWAVVPWILDLWHSSLAFSESQEWRPKLCHAVPPWMRRECRRKRWTGPSLSPRNQCNWDWLIGDLHGRLWLGICTNV